ncbi:MAG: PrpF family protein, partial [Proteobacteria bacterium]|nr:PrpF family protein [Pseudomonadota bacterium]
MPQRKLPAVFMRGGTSKAVILHSRDLPANRDDWAPILLSFMGSPDPNMRQLDGMGGGVSSLSKVCIIGPPTRP